MLRTLGKLRRLLSGARAGLRREEMDGAHFATLGDRPFVGCQPCAPDPQGRAAPAARPNPPAAPRPAGDDG
ncbi:MAG: hypothetical protein QNJ30_15985 [Kiloniellales bacterium]|nr:hypothetical protein [Kiloniellales bacterium]